MGPDPANLLSYSKNLGIIVQAYSPLGSEAHAQLLGNAVVVAIAAAHGKSPAQVSITSTLRNVWFIFSSVSFGFCGKKKKQVCLKFVLQLGLPLATSTVSESFMEDDLGVWGWDLSAAEMAQLNQLNITDDDPVKSMCIL